MMALNQSALLEVLKGAGAEDRIRQAAETIYQALIEAEDGAVWTVFLRSLRAAAWLGCNWSPPARTPA
jgi:hypothetical protein